MGHEPVNDTARNRYYPYSILGRSLLSDGDRLPKWLIGLVMFLPTLVWFVDITYTRESRQWLRILVAFLICVSLLATIIILTKPFETEW